MSYSTTPPTSTPKLVRAQQLVLGLILVLALYTTGVTAYLLHPLEDLKKRSYAEFLQKCHRCPFPSWYQGDQDTWEAEGASFSAPLTAGYVAHQNYKATAWRWEPAAIASIAFGATTTAYVLAR
jgi:hypothetical protein